MKKFLEYLLLSAVSVLGAVACKAGKQASSAVKFDWNHSENLDFAQLSAKLKEEICSRSPVVFFIGNSEHPLIIKTNRPSTFEGSTEKLNAIINQAKKDLTTSLGKKPLACESADSKKNSRALLVFVTDGPYKNDSIIEK